MKALFLILFFFSFQLANVFSTNPVSKSLEDYEGKGSVQNIIRHVYYRTVLNTDDQQFANNFHDDEWNESEDPLRDFFAGGNFSIKCMQDILYILGSLQNLTNPWALKLLDSYGKPGAGILEGNFRWLGNYLECLDVFAPPAANTSAGNFKGKYCSLNFNLQLSENASIPLTTGVCIPDTCSATELSVNFVTLLRIAKTIPALNSNTSFINVTSFTCKENTKALNAPAIAVICLISFFGLLVLLGSSLTAYEHYFVEKLSISEKNESSLVIMNEEPMHSNKDDDVANSCHDSNTSSYSDLLEKCKPFFKCFCIFTNGSKLLNTDQTEGQLLCIHGIRFLSMSWVILGHTYQALSLAITNMLQAYKQSDNLAFQVVYQGFFSVDSFFVLSGLLLTYLFMQECSKNKGKISWTYFYIHRYLRLTPVYMIILGISSTVYFYLGSGPNWPDQNIDPVCADWWWTNLLYINNFFSAPHRCMTWSWYLACDMQFFIVSPLFLITLWKWPKVAYSLLGIFLLGTFCATFSISYYYDLGLELTLIGNLGDVGNAKDAIEKLNSHVDKLNIKPYTRIAPYLIGIILGYFVFKTKTENRPKMSRIALLCGWFVASAVTLTVVYGLYHRHPSSSVASFYNAVSRAVFACGLSWVIYVCLTDQGGFVNKILSFKLFIPLSRLTYSAYLIHPLFIVGYFASEKAGFSASHPMTVLLFLGFMLITYSFALLVSLIFESPIIGLEKLIRRKFSSK